MEKIILPNKQKVTRLAIRLGIINVICLILLLVPLFFMGTFSFASKHSIPLMEAANWLLQGLAEFITIESIFWILPSILTMSLLPLFSFNSMLKNGRFRVVLDGDGITSQAGSFKKHISWDNFVQVLPVKYLAGIWMSSNSSGKVFVPDVFDLDELNLQISTFRKG